MNAVTPSRWFRFNIWLHRWASLVATLPFLVLCITGTVLIFHEEIDHAMNVVPAAQVSANMPRRPLAESVNNILASSPGQRLLSIGIDPEHHPGVLLLVTSAEGERNFDNAKLRYADLYSGKPIGDPDAGQTLTGFLLELHAQWFLGPVGELIGALIALLVFFSLLSGLVVYAPYVKRVALGVLRRGRGPRLLQLDLHNFIGVLVIGWALVVTATGFLLGFSTVAIGLWQMTELSGLREQAARLEPVDARKPPVNIDQAYAAAQAAAPQGWHVQSLIVPATDFSTPRHYTVLLGGSSGIDARMFRVVIIDAKTGEVAAAPEVPAYLKAISLSEPLHFGDYGGLPLKILWTTCTWLTLFITANGAWLWWDRRRRLQSKQIAGLAQGDIG